MMINLCHTLVCPWSMAPGMGQGLGGQQDQVPHLSYGVDEISPGLAPSRSHDPQNCPADLALGLPSVPSMTHPRAHTAHPHGCVGQRL